MPAETDASTETTSAAAPADDVAADADVAPAHRRRWSPRRQTREEAWLWAGDAVSLVVLGAVLLWWEMHDGARPRDPVVTVAIMTLVASPVLVDEGRRLSRTVQALLVAYSIGWLVAVAFAVDRHAWVSALLVVAVVPSIALLTRRIWRRPWGPPVLLALLVAGFARYTYRSWLQWWGTTMMGNQPRWMPLSWHNQSGALMGAFGLMFLGVAWCGRRTLRFGLALAAGIAFAGVYLSSSRGAVAFTAAAAVVMLVVGMRSLRSPKERQGLIVATIGSLVTAVTVSMLLLAMLPSGTTTPLESRGATASRNAIARIEHMEAALRMFVDRPLAGQGPGSYEIMALDHTDPGANLTTSAHNEYAEVLGEGGLVGGAPFILLHVALAVAIWRRMRWGVPLEEFPDDDALVDLRGAMAVGAVGLVAVVAGHSGFDFDWDYPVLPALLAIGAGILAHSGDARGDRGTGDGEVERHLPRGWGGAALALLLVVALGGHLTEVRLGGGSLDLSPVEYAQTGVPWDARTRGDIAGTLMFDGHVELARAVAEDALTWNPGIDRLRRIRAMIRYEQGELNARDLASTLEYGRSRFQSYIDVADQLIEDGEYAVASEVLADVQAQMRDYADWGVNSLVVDAGIRQIVIAGDVEGCAAAQRVAEELREAPAARSLEGTEAAIERAVGHACA